MFKINFRASVVAALLGLTVVAGATPVLAGSAFAAPKEAVVDSSGAISWNYDIVAQAGTNAEIVVYSANPTDSTTTNWYTNDYTVWNSTISSYVDASENVIGSWDIYNEDGATDKAASVSVRASDYKPGTYHVAMYAFDNTAYQAKVTATTTGEYIPRSSFYSVVDLGTITVTPSIYVNAVVASNSIQLNFTRNANVTGYEVYRKVGSKYVKIATTTEGTYTDKGLETGKTYKYQVKPYFVNAKTGEKTYGIAKKFSAATVGADFDVDATLTGKKLNQVKITWDKVKGAKSYNIYRCVTDSATSVIKKGDADWYEAYELVKTVKKSKKSYIDKKVEAGLSYSYRVEAVLADADGDKVTQEGWSSASLAFDGPSLSAYTNADGSITATWDIVSGADGYIVYQQVYDAATDRSSWVEIQRLGKKETAKTFAAIDAGAAFADDILLVAPQSPSYVGSVTEYTWNGVKYATWEEMYQAYRASEYYADPDYDFDSSCYTYTSYSQYEFNGTVYNSYEEAWDAYYVANNKYRAELTKAQKNNSASYRIRAYKGANVSEESSTITVTPVIGAVTGVTATQAENGINVSWNPVPGANFYRVYRVKAGSVVTDKTSGIISNTLADAEVVTIYNGVTPLVQAPVEAGSTDTSVKYFQNYVYASNNTAATSILDYAGQIATSSDTTYKVAQDAARQNITTDLDGEKKDVYTAKTVPADQVKTVGPQAGVAYQYYVVAYYDADFATNNLDYNGKTSANKLKYTYMYNPATNMTSATNALYRITDNWDVSSSVKAVSKSVTMSATKAAKAPAVKSVKAGKKQVTITMKKAAAKAGVTEYKIYRSTKKNGKYTSVGTTTSAKFVDKSVKAGKKYYYKVVAVTANEAGADVESKASKAKSVSVK